MREAASAAGQTGPAGGARRARLAAPVTAAVLGVVSLALAVLYVPLASASSLLVLEIAAFFASFALPVAILKYRLYEIDRIISRTLAYAIVTGLLIGVYAGLVLLATRVLPLSLPVAVAASTLAVAALFSPVRRRVQRAVDPAVQPGSLRRRPDHRRVRRPPHRRHGPGLGTRRSGRYRAPGAAARVPLGMGQPARLNWLPMRMIRLTGTKDPLASGVGL